MLLQGVLFGLLSLFGWGTSDFFAAISSRKIGNTKTLFWSLTIGITLFGIYTFLFFPDFHLSQTFLFLMAIAAFLQICGTFLFLKAFEIGKVSLVSPVASSFGMWTSIFSLIFLHERISLYQGIIVCIILIGIFLISTNLKELKKNARYVTSDKGVFLAFCASLFWAASFTTYSPLVKNYGWLQSVLSLRIFMFVFIAIFILSTRQTIFFAKKTTNILLVLGTGVMDVFGYAGYSLALSHGLTAIVSPIAAAFPLITVSCARVFLKEKLLLSQFVGVILIILGLVLLSF